MDASMTQPVFRKVHLDLDFSQFLEADYSVHTGTCTVHQVHEMQDIYEQVGALPDSYCMANTMIHQLWWTREQVDYRDLGHQLGMEVISVSTIKQPAGCVIPYHRDTFFKIKEQYPGRDDVKVRANIYLEDYKLGHFIQYTLDGQYHTSDRWSAGDGFLWDSGVLHLSANAGMQPKYTLQVSGFLIGETS